MDRWTAERSHAEMPIRPDHLPHTAGRVLEAWRRHVGMRFIFNLGLRQTLPKNKVRKSKKLGQEEVIKTVW